MGRRPWPLHWLLVVGLALLALFLLVARADADPGAMPLYHYGIGDGHLGQQTAFAESWMRPAWVPDRVRRDWPGVALRGYPPGTAVRLTVVGLPEWADTWPGLSDAVVGCSTVAFVADRPGGPYGDAWWGVFGELAPHWVGKVYVEIEVLWQPSVAIPLD